MAAKIVKHPSPNQTINRKNMFSAMAFAQQTIHKAQMKNGEPETIDHMRWRDAGWLDGKKPWK
ncbi:MAG: hypothetical protein LBP30_08105 [Clostridiales Family XIII bacterium]|nr:hypothetical protein [Clostridiales Family XIII bacterium]